MKLRRDCSDFAAERAMRDFCRQLEAQGFREAEPFATPLHRNYSVQCWLDGAEVRHWRVAWHEHAKR